MLDISQFIKLEPGTNETSVGAADLEAEPNSEDSISDYLIDYMPEEPA